MSSRTERLAVGLLEPADLLPGFTILLLNRTANILGQQDCYVAFATVSNRFFLAALSIT
jgi:hypothetical protein